MQIIDERETYGSINCRTEPSDSFCTFGGEYWVDDDHYGEYGLDCGEVCFYYLSPSQYKSLGLQIINHLMANGHDFEIGKDVNGAFLKAKA